jgi:hypothetical protein
MDHHCLIGQIPSAATPGRRLRAVAGDPKYAELEKKYEVDVANRRPGHPSSHPYSPYPGRSCLPHGYKRFRYLSPGIWLLHSFARNTQKLAAALGEKAKIVIVDVGKPKKSQRLKAGTLTRA